MKTWSFLTAWCPETAPRGAMFEAKLARAELFKHIIASFKDLCGNVNFECSERGLVLQVLL